MTARLVKDRSILRLLGRLKSRLGDKAFDAVDGWDGDLFAIGVARPDKHGILVYVSTYEQPDATYFVSLELPPLRLSDLPYRQGPEFEVRSFEELVAVIKRHFSEADPKSNTTSQS